MRTFFCETIPAPGEAAELEKSEFDHLFRTLRAAPGDEVALFDGCGLVAVARVEPRRTLVIQERRREPEPARRLHLYCAVPRRAKFDVLLMQAAELGVWSIRLLHCERSVAQPEGSGRWETLLREGCKQSKNPFLPRILPMVKPSEALEEIRARKIQAFFGAVDAGKASPREETAGGDFAWLVGPEGGFTPEEEQAFLAAGVRGLNLGPYVLRLETAAVCGLAVLRQRMAGEAER